MRVHQKSTYTETINQAPWGSDTEDQVMVESRRYREKLYKEKGYTCIELCSRESDRKISGVTEIIYKPEESDFMQQDLTGVSDKFRRGGLSRRLKAQMLFFIRENYLDVEYITLGNALANKGMLSINQLWDIRKQTYSVCTNMWCKYRYVLFIQIITIQVYNIITINNITL